MRVEIPITEVDVDVDVVLEDVKEAADEAKEVAEDAKDETKPAELQEVVDVVTTAKLITEVVTAASKTITAASTNITAAEAQVLAITLTAAPARVTTAPSRIRKGVVIRDPEEESTTSTIIPSKTKSNDKGVNTPRSVEDRLELMELMVFLLPKVNDVTRLQALVDKKKVVGTEATIREALRLDDEEGVECLPNEEIFAELAIMGYEKP
nr:hypothetical protein [Tanacetum cinerariifolium]